MSGMRRACALPVFLALAVLSADAMACPKRPVAEAGGEHRCLSVGRGRGNIHLWTPEGYDAATAVTVVYLHGYDIDAPRRGKPRYLDRLWESHGLAPQFARSGLNALFIAVEMPTSPRRRNAWTSLDAVLSAVRRRGVPPPSRVVAVAHSAGIYAVLRFLGDHRLAHVIAVDALYRSSPERLAEWYRGSPSRRLTVIGAKSLPRRSSELAHRLECPIAQHLSDLESMPSTSVRCAAYVDAELGHMEAVTDGTVIPSALGRIDLGIPKRPHRPPRHLGDGCGGE